MKLKEYIQRVISVYSKGAQSIDNRLSPRLVYSKLVTARLRLLALKVNKKQKLSSSATQNLTCIELIRAPLIECPCAPPVGCNFLRSRYPIPKLVTSLFGPILESVMTLDGSTVFNPTTRSGIRHEVNNRYTGSSPRYFIDEYLYVLGKNKPKYIGIFGAVFEDPIEAEKFNYNCSEGSSECFDALESEFPFDGDLIDPLVEITIQELVGYFTNMRQDVKNNASDDTVDDNEDRMIKHENAKTRDKNNNRNS